MGISYRHSSPYHPRPCGKVERFHQTLKRWLARQEAAAGVRELQVKLDRFGSYHNEVRPYRAIGRRTLPRRSQLGRRGATAAGVRSPDHFRVRRDKVDITGTITLRHNSRPHHIGLGRRLIGTRVLVLVADRDVRVLSEDGELIRRLTLDPARDYQPHGGS